MEEKKISNRDSALRKISARLDNHFTVSVTGILKSLKRFLALWIALSVVVSLLTLAVSAYSKQDTYKKMTSLVSFTFDGVEKGLDPNGNKFYVNSMKSQRIVEEALEKSDLPLDKADDIRRCITFEGIIPQDAIQRITSYTNVFGGNGTVSTSEQISDVSYYPTQYRVHFDYAPTELSGNEAAEFLNNMLECYNQYFFETYGYNQSLGNSLNAFNYQDYDYAEALDVFDSALTKLSKYITQVSSTDTTRFRSEETGKTFADLTATIDTLREQDFDRISSYVTINTVTKDKETLLTFYMFKVEELQRRLNVYNESLATVNDSITNYKKNTIMVFGSNGEQADISGTETSEEYDKLFKQKQDIQKNLSSTAQEITLYNKRIERLNSSTQANSANKIAHVEEEFSKLNTQIENVIDLVHRTTDDYYRTVVFPKAYNVLVPANSSFVSTAKRALSDAMMPILIIDALVFVFYLGASTIFAVRDEYMRIHGFSAASGKKAKKKSEKSSKKKKDSEEENKE